MLLFMLNLDDVAPPVESTGGAVLVVTAPVAIDTLDATVALLQLESELAQLQVDSPLMPALEAEV
jgi:hypothetical protein